MCSGRCAKRRCCHLATEIAVTTLMARVSSTPIIPGTGGTGMRPGASPTWSPLSIIAIPAKTKIPYRKKANQKDSHAERHASTPDSHLGRLASRGPMSVTAQFVSSELNKVQTLCVVNDLKYPQPIQRSSAPRPQKFIIAQAARAQKLRDVHHGR